MMSDAPDPLLQRRGQRLTELSYSPFERFQHFALPAVCAEVVIRVTGQLEVLDLVGEVGNVQQFL